MTRVVTKAVDKCTDCPYMELQHDWIKETNRIYCTAIIPPRFAGQYWDFKDGLAGIPDWCPFPEQNDKV
jgi:hypothetical protein